MLASHWAGHAGLDGSVCNSHQQHAALPSPFWVTGGQTVQEQCQRDLPPDFPAAVQPPLPKARHHTARPALCSIPRGSALVGIGAPAGPREPMQPRSSSACTWLALCPQNAKFLQWSLRHTCQVAVIKTLKHGFADQKCGEHRSSAPGGLDPWAASDTLLRRGAFSPLAAQAIPRSPASVKLVLCRR